MRLLVFCLVLLLPACPAFAQSLADVARKEAERRQTLTDAGKSYTNKDLRPVAQPPPSAEDEKKPDDAGEERATGDDRQAESPADADAAEKVDGEKAEVKDRDYWAARQTALHEQLERDETYAAALQSRIDALTMDFVNRDDPVQRDQIAIDRQRAITELDRLKKAIEDQRRAIDDFEEEARRNGVPPGWLR
jgi:hypothetical protein